MKRYLSVLIAVLMVAGLATAAGAALTFDVDFWTDGTNPVNNYAQGGPGDLGGTFDLLPGEQINVDIYFTTDLNVTSGSWDLQFNPSNLAVVGTEAAGGFWVLPLFQESAGSEKYQDAYLPGSSQTPGTFFFGSVLFECTGPSVDILSLHNDLGFFEADTPLDQPILFTEGNLGTLSQVPIPGTIWLLGAGLAGLVGIRRNRRK
jgi:hypothetical protein